MKFIQIIVLVTLSYQAHSWATNSLEGMWKLSSIIYRQQPMPLPNPDLNLYFKFYGNGDSWLRWSRKNEEGFCERKAEYIENGRLLYQKTIWLNPRNALSCGNDPEMRPSSETYTEFSIIQKKLYLNLDLSDEKIIYVFSFLPEESENKGNETINRVNGL